VPLLSDPPEMNTHHNIRGPVKPGIFSIADLLVGERLV
jgi:hypothetical protein